MSRASILIAVFAALAAVAGCGGQPSSTANPPVNSQQATSEEKNKADVILKSYNDKKISVIKAVREITGLGLADAKNLVESVPASVKRGVSREEAEQIRLILEQAGATVEIRW